MAGVQEENRRRIALLLLGLGLALITIGVGMGIVSYRSARPAETTSSSAKPPPPRIQLERDKQARLIQQVLFLLLVLVGILSVSLYAFHLWSRRFRRMLFRKPAPPTPSEDAWAMHQLPEIDQITDGPGEE